MVAPVPVSSWKQFLGIAKETTKGTPVSAADFIPITGKTLTPIVNYLEDRGMRGSLVDIYNEVASVTGTDFEFAGNVHPDTIGYPLAGILGEVATTGASAPYTHAITLLNSGTGQPTGYTITDQYVAGTRYVPGLQFEEVAFAFTADGLLTYTARGKGFPTQTVSAPTATFSTIAPMASWICTTTIAGSATTLLLSGTLSIKRTVERVFTMANTQAPTNVWGGLVSVDGHLDLIMEGDAELTRYLTNTQPALLLDFSQGAGAALVQVKFQLTKCAYVAGRPDHGQDYVVIPIDFKGVGNSTDVGASGGYGPAKVTLQNAKAASTYV